MNIIKVARTKLNLTQNELSDILNVTTQTINAWENNKQVPSVSQLVKLSLHLKLTLDELMEHFSTL